MNITGLVFIFIVFAIIKPMVLTSLGEVTGQPEIAIELPDSPTFELNTTNLFDFVGVSGFDAIEEATYNIAIAIGDTGRIVLAVIEFILDIILYIGQLTAFIVLNAFTGIQGAPVYVNAILATPAAIMLGTIIYKLARSGESDD